VTTNPNKRTAREALDDMELDTVIQYRYSAERRPVKTVDGDDAPDLGDFTNDGDHDVFDPWGWTE
jgi:hypothetical protein